MANLFGFRVMSEIGTFIWGPQNYRVVDVLKNQKSGDGVYGQGQNVILYLLCTGPLKCVSCIRGVRAHMRRRRDPEKCVCRCATRVRTAPVCVECRVQTGARISLSMIWNVSYFTIITVYELVRLLYSMIQNHK